MNFLSYLSSSKVVKKTTYLDSFISDYLNKIKKIQETEEYKTKDQKFKDILKDYQVREYPIINIEYEYAYRKEALEKKPYKANFVKNINDEIKLLKENLPLSLDASIFVVYDSDQYNVFKVLITGASSTPYAHGCFIFDIFLPYDYPNVPPLVKLVTTNGGKVRFNPNLYSCGKVCLSLLNTWSGPQWIPNKSNLLQVLLSIQSLIMNHTPIDNEPGMENTTTIDNKVFYNYYIKHITSLYSIVNYINKTELIFDDIFMEYFKLKKDYIIDDLKYYLMNFTHPNNTYFYGVNLISLDEFKYTVVDTMRALSKF